MVFLNKLNNSLYNIICMTINNLYYYKNHILLIAYPF